MAPCMQFAAFNPSQLFFRWYLVRWGRIAKLNKNKITRYSRLSKLQVTAVKNDLQQNIKKDEETAQGFSALLH